MAVVPSNTAPYDGPPTNPAQAVTATGSFNANDPLAAKFLTINATAAAVTLTLATPVAGSYPRVLIKRVDASGNAATIATQGAEQIEGADTYVLPAAAKVGAGAVDLQWSGTGWLVVGGVFADAT